MHQLHWKPACIFLAGQSQIWFNKSMIYYLKKYKQKWVPSEICYLFSILKMFAVPVKI